MPLSGNFPKAIGFVVGDFKDGRRGALGTAFLVRFPATAYDGTHFYFVTAAHIVAGERNLEVRVRNKTGGTCELEASEWFPHWSEDVAVAPIEPQLALAHDIATIPFHDFLDQRQQGPQGTSFEPNLGDDVFFLGLLADIPEMAEANVPMVRSGCLGAFLQEGVSLRGFGKLGEVHLIDCRSYEGFSGSPCFVQFVPPKVTPYTWTLLLGLIAGHFDGPPPESTEAGEGKSDELRRPLHTGVGIVTPVQRITELLLSEELVEQRTLFEADHIKLHREGSQGATPDS